MLSVAALDIQVERLDRGMTRELPLAIPRPGIMPTRHAHRSGTSSRFSILPISWRLSSNRHEVGPRTVTV